MTGPKGNDTERQADLGRVEAFSDGVIAIIITIMVLELKVPEEQGLHGLIGIGPTFLAYVLSFAYVAIYWVNHHRLFSHALRSTNGLLWSNIGLLFSLSLVPFATAYLGDHQFGAFAVRLYMASLLLPSLTYMAMQAVIARQCRTSAAALQYLAATRRKGIVSTVIYLAGLVGSFFSTPVALLAAVVVAVLWILPYTPLDRLFEAKAASKRDMTD